MKKRNMKRKKVIVITMHELTKEEETELRKGSSGLPLMLQIALSEFSIVCRRCSACN